MKIKYIVLIIILILSAGSSFYFLKPTQVKVIDGDYPLSNNYVLHTIQDLKSGNNETGFYDIEGYIVKDYTCPFCPEGDQCKPCMKDNIIVSEKKVYSDNNSLSDDEILLFVNGSKEFKLGEKYRFSIKLLNSKNINGKINYELVGLSRIVE
jgi:hypothetical protein